LFLEMSKPRILIITNGHLCRHPRPLKEADTLGRAGYDVIVLTVRNHPPSEALDRGLLRDAPFRCEAIDMLDASRPAVFGRRLWLWLARHAASQHGLPTVHSLGPAGALLRHARRIPTDLTIVHTELPFWVGARLLRDGRRVAADFEDWHSEDLLPADRARRPLSLIRKTEQTLLRQAAYTSTTSQALAAALNARNGGRLPVVITNSFPLQREPRFIPPGDPPAFFWFSQTLGPGRGLESFLQAWARTAHSSRLVLLGDPSAGFDDYVRQQLPPDRRTRVSFLPTVPPVSLPATIAAHDIGLALEPAEIPSRDLTITNKILQYLNAGLAIVASDTAGQREVLARGPDAGVIVDFHDTTSAAAALEALLADREALARRQKAARQLAQAVYCWEREAPRLLAAVEAALAATHRP
jgi:glycosyltransferase involved in cell wall biosynthesis